MRDTVSLVFVALRVTLVTLLCTGILYPLGMTGLCGLLFPSKAHGSLITDNKGRVVGSALIAQRFQLPTYFSATTLRCRRARV